VNASGQSGRFRRPSRGTVLRVGAGVVALTGTAIAFATQASKLSSIEWRFAPGWLLVGICAFVLLQAVLCALWLSLVRRLGAELPARVGAAAWCVSALGRYAPTGALMIIGRIDMTWRAGVPRRICAASIFYELVFAVGGALVVGAGSVATVNGIAPVLRWAALALGLAGLVAMHPRIVRPVVDRMLERFGSEPLPVVLPVRDVALYAAGYIASYLLAGLGTLFLAKAVHPVEWGDAGVLIASFAVGFAASIVGFLSPGGLGAREVAQATTLVGVLPFAVGLAVAVLIRLVQITVEVVFAGVTWLIARRAAEPMNSGSGGG
jgi:glycosyltransferase 2 family protein